MFLFKNKYGELRSGWSVTALLLLTIFGLGVGSAMVPADGADATITLKIAVTLIYCIITIGGSIFLFKMIYRRGLSQMGFTSKGGLSGLLYGFVWGSISIGLIFVVLLFTGQVQVTGIDVGKLVSATMLAEFFSVGMMAFSEEVLMRGYLMTALKPTKSKWLIFLAPAILFSLFHIMNPGFTPLSLLNTFLAGVLFAYMFVKSGNIWLSSGFHIAWNFVQGNIFGMIVSGNSQMSVFQTTFGSNEILTGGNYGPEGGILVTLVLILGILYIRFIFVRPKEPAWTMESERYSQAKG